MAAAVKRGAAVPRLFVVGAQMVRPRPADLLGDHLELELILRCRCGRGREVRVGELAAQHRLAPATPLAQLVGRLRCLGCGRGFPPPGRGPAVPEVAEVREVSQLRVRPFPPAPRPPGSALPKS